MKFSKLALTGALALAFAGSAFAQTTIRIVGSTAFRAPVNDAILRIFGTNNFTFAITGKNPGPNPSGSDIAGASQGIFVGTLDDNAINNINGLGYAYSGDGQVIIKTYWSGSVSGVGELVESSSNIAFIADATQPGGTNGAAAAYNGTLPVTGGVELSSSYTAEPANSGTPDISWTDVNQSADGLALSKAISSKDSQNVNSAPLQEAGTLNPGSQGIVFFEVLMESLGNNNASAPISSLSTDQFATLITAGNISLAQINGGSSTSDLFLIGRSEDSGSRANTFSNVFEGFAIGGPVVQYLPSYSGSVATYKDTGATSAGYPTTVQAGGTGSQLVSLAPWPKNWSINFLPSAQWNSAGHSGFVSGGNVATALEASDPVTGVPVTLPSGSTVTPTATYVVGYLGGPDANSALAQAVPYKPILLQYNGTSYSQAAVLSGQYNLWGYEHCYYYAVNGSGGSEGTSTVGDVGDAISDFVFTKTAEDNNALVPNDTTHAAAGIFLPSNANQKVIKNSPGAPAVELYKP